MRRLLGFPLLAFLAACPPAIDTGDDGGGVITAGPEGGIFVRGGAVLEIPKGALSIKTLITITVLDSGIPEVPGRKRVSLGYRMSPSGLTFSKPVRVSIPYQEERVPAGLQPDTFDMRRQSGEDAYLALPEPGALTEFKAEQANTDRLGLFWVTSPAEPAVNTLTLEPLEVDLKVGDTQQFTATAKDPAGNLLDLKIAWTALPPRATSVAATGLLKALAPGNATLTATAGKLVATATVRIRGTAKGPQTFVHENPFPTGNDLYGGAFGPSGSAFFGGANATVLARTGPTVWDRLYSSPGVVLKAIGGTQSNAVSVGVSGLSGVVVEINSSTTPKVTVFPTVQPRALWFDGTYGMAVGDGNDVLVRRAGTWVKEYSPSFESLLSVVGDGVGGFVTLGARGSIYRFDPVTQTWNSLFQTQLAVLLNAASLVDSAGSEAWAVGGTKLWHFVSGGWVAINLPDSVNLTELTAVAKVDDKVALAGRSGKQGLLLVYDPSSSGAANPDGGLTLGWTSVTLTGPQVIRNLFAQGAQGYAVGDFGAVWQYGAGTFTELSRGFYGDVADVAVASGLVMAAVNECTTLACTKRVGKVWSRTGPGTWAPLGGAQPFTTPIYSIAARSLTDVLVGADGAVFHLGSGGWSQVALAGAVSGPLYDVQFCGNDVWVVGATGTVLRGTSELLSNFQSPAFSDLYAIHCPAAGQVWLSGDFGLYELVGNQFTAHDSATVSQSLWRAVWSPGSGEAFAFGLSRYAVYWDTAQLRSLDSPGGLVPDVFTGLWGSSIDNLYAVGQTVTPLATGYAIRFDGAHWQLVDSGAQRKATSVMGAPGQALWIGTEGGGVLRGVTP